MNTLVNEQGHRLAQRQRELFRCNKGKCESYSELFTKWKDLLNFLNPKDWNANELKF